jgi:hypothetical protein
MENTTPTETKAIIVLDALKALDFKLEEGEAKEIKEAFMPTVQAISELDKEFFDIIANPLEATTPERAERAKKLRLKLVEKRGTKGIKGIHEKRKAYYLNGGRFVDSIKNTVTSCLESAEEKLEAIENYFINIEKDRVKKLHEERLEALKPFEIFLTDMNFGQMPEADWNHYFNFTKTTFEKKKEEEKAETERIANLKTENEWLKTQTETLKTETVALKQVAQVAQTENTELRQQLEQKEEKEKTQKEIITGLVEKIESMDFQCTQWPLKNSLAWRELKLILSK